MILAADMGNTTFTVGLLYVEEFVATGRISTHMGSHPAEYEAALRALLPGSGAVAGAILSSVVPGMNDIVLAALGKIAPTAPLLVTPGMNTGLSYGTYDPAGIGMDRVVDLVAAKAMTAGAVAVFDMGTCTTVSVADKSGTICGGMIMPGIQMSLDAMHSHTARLPQLQATAAEGVIGHGTAACMINGAVFAAAAVIDDVSQRIGEALGEDALTVVTGGHAPLALPWCRRPVHHEPNLLLKGLGILYHRN